MEHFIECTKPYPKSDIVIIGYPYDGTSSFRPGSRFAPSAIRHASYGLETYSPYFDLDISNLKVCDKGDLVLPFGSKEQVLKLISKSTSSLLMDRKKILSLGGEHLISYPIVKEYIKTYPSLIILHFDAHADLRNTYLGETMSHATVIRRIFSLVGDNKIYQFGIRSGTSCEFNFGKEHCHFYPFNLDSLAKIVSTFSFSTPIYITIDLDILDPSIMPGTGTPEPGGVSFLSLIDAIYTLKGKNVLGIDIVELAPHYDNSGVSSIVAAKLVRECLFLF